MKGMLLRKITTRTAILGITLATGLGLAAPAGVAHAECANAVQPAATPVAGVARNAGEALLIILKYAGLATAGLLLLGMLSDVFMSHVM